jgi:hypothetical protein
MARRPFSILLGLAVVLGGSQLFSPADATGQSNVSGIPDRSFPSPVREALRFVEPKVSFPVEGLVKWPDRERLSASAVIGQRGAKYSVQFFPCRPPLPLNSRRLDACVKSNIDIIGGFSGTRYATAQEAQVARTACSAWACEGLVQVPCAAGSPNSTVDGQIVSECGGTGNSFPQEVSWTNGTWSILLMPTTPEEWRAQATALVAESRRVHLPQAPGFLECAPGNDNENTLAVWTVGSVNYSIEAYFGGAMTEASDMRTLRGS